MPEPLLVGPRDAAEIVGIGRDRMYRLVADGRIRSVALGRKRLIPRQELERWIEREMEGGGRTAETRNNAPG